MAPMIVITAEKRHKVALNQVRNQAQDLPSSHTVCTNQSYQGNPDRVIVAQQDPTNSALCRELGRIAHINDNASTYINGASGHSIRHKTVNAEKRNMKTPKQIMQKPQTQLSCHVTSLEHAQAESANVAIHVQDKQQKLSNDANHRENKCTRLANETIADNIKRRTRQLSGLNGRSAEKRQGQTTNDATQQVPNDSVVCKELHNQITHIDKSQDRYSMAAWLASNVFIFLPRDYVPPNSSFYKPLENTYPTPTKTNHLS